MSTDAKVGKSTKEKNWLNSRGFVTVATGTEKYHRLAYILLTSYRIKSKNPLPFCVITDSKSHYTDAFDDVVLIDDAKHSYLDKIDVLIYSPYEESIFIDSDCIAYRDLNDYWEKFENASCMSAFGEIHPLNSGRGWYRDSAKLGIYQDKVKYSVGLHGGIYYFRKGETLNKIYNDCYDIIKDYKGFSFWCFEKPADEPVIALAMGINQCKPVTSHPKDFVWRRKASRLKVDFFSGILTYISEGVETNNTMLIHFGTQRTDLPLYLFESKKVLAVANGKSWTVFDWIKNMINSYFFGGIRYICFAFDRLTQKLKQYFKW